MIDLVGYEKVTPIFSEEDLSLCRAVRDYDGSPVLIKTPTSKLPCPRLLAGIKNEYATSLEIGKIGAIHPIALHQTDNSLALIFEDKGYELLDHFINRPGIDLHQKIILAIKAVNALNCVHAKGFLHRNIKPDSFAVSHDMHEVVLTSFQLCSRLSDSVSGTNIGLISDSYLPYISPEQSGRISDSLDRRSDFYSLGITLFELFTGELPFNATDALELIHCHLAQEPTSPHIINPEITEQLSSVILKLIAKNPGDRYQSTYGIKQDLKTCLKISESSYFPENFRPGERDVSDTFTLTRRLFGRKNEKHILLKIFEKTTQGSCEVVMVRGEPGSGKTTLINELRNHVAHARGEIITGKFDQFKRNIPYSALIQAFQKLIRKRLTNPAPVISAWKNHIIERLGSNAGLIIEVIPELELLIGPQKSPAKLPLTEARNRFNLVFKNFIKIFPNLDHPLVLFIDDLQWADTSTTTLINELIADNETSYLLLIGAYRDNNSLANSVKSMLAEIKRSDKQVETITLSRLGPQQVLSLITRTLRTNRPRAGELTKLIFNRTGGNPLFVREYLRNLYRADLIKFNYDKSRWEWDINAIREMSIDGNIVELMADKINNLSIEGQSILKVASCIGGKFDLKTLIAVVDLPQEKVISFLNIALHDGLIISSDETPIGATLTDFNLKWAPQLSFMHDRVQQAAYSLLGLAEKESLHLKIGRTMLQIFEDSEIEEMIFDIALQFNSSFSTISGETERTIASNIFCRASRKAKRSSAFDLASKYFYAAEQLQQPNCWAENYTSTFNLYLDWFECEYMSGGPKKAEEIFDLMLEHVKNRQDLSQIKLAKIMIYTNKSRYKDAVKIALDLLSLFGMKIPEHPSNVSLTSELLKTNFLLRNKTVEDLYNLPDMSHPEMLETMQLMMHTIAPAYMYNKQLVFFIVLKMLRLSLKHGNAPSSSFGYMFYAMFLAAKDFSFDKSKDYTRLAVDLNKRFKNTELETKINLLRGCAHDHWHVSLSQNISTLENAFHSGHLTGDTTYARYASYFAAYYKFIQGYTLTDVIADVDKYLNVLHNSPNMLSTGILQLIKQISKSLEGKTYTPGFLDDEYFNEKQLLGAAKNSSSEVIFHWAKISKLITLSFFGLNDKALEIIEELEGTIEKSLFGMLNVPIYHFFSVINMAAVYEEVSSDHQRRYRKVIKKSISKLKVWSDNCPENFQHLHLLATAEYHQLTGRMNSALSLYEEATSTSLKNGFNNFAALSCELAGKFHFKIGGKRSATSLISEACQYYGEWGAKAKVQQLIANYHSLQEEFTPSVMDINSQQNLTKSKRSNSLDLSAVMKASQAISGEIVLARLLDKLMRIVIENAGAQKATLLLNNKNRLELTAHASVTQKGITTQVKPSVDTKSYCESIVNYVFRSKDNIVLRDASAQGPFTIDSYIIRNKPKSVLAMPIINQQVMRGVLYLENNLSPGVFTEERLEVLNLLCSQAAISIQNARLYSDLRESETQHRTLLENINVGAYRAEANLEGKLVKGNRALAKMFGYSGWDTFQNTPIQSLFLHKENHYVILNELLNGDTVREREVEMKTKDGTPIWVNMTASLHHDDDGNSKCLEGVLEDITEQKKTRQLERAKVAADAANQAKSEFLASMSHEIRTPMNAILGMADMLWESRLSKAQRNYVNLFKNAGENLLLLINDILDLSKIEAGQITIENIEFNLEDLFEEIGSIFALRAQVKGIDLCWYIAPEVPKLIVGDPTRIRQIIVNLVGNALKFTDKGSVTYEAALTESGLVRVVIRDTGIGIPDSKMNPIFETFSQADSSTTRNFGGTGLGLSICMRMIKCMKGGLFVSSQEGEGSSFAFTMNLDFPEQETPKISLNDLSVLLIDKDSPSRTYLKQALSNLGATVQIATTMNEATIIAAEMSILGSRKKALLVGTPEWESDCFEVIKALKKDLCSTWKLIMLMEAKPKPRATARAKQLGATYVQRPIQPRAIATEINTADTNKTEIDGFDEIDCEMDILDSPEIPKEGASILLIEDSEDNRMVVDLYLKETPFQITMAENGKEGLDKYIGGAYDLILMDIQMPIMDGYEATKAIRQYELEHEMERIPILALTANAFQEDAQNCINCGCTAHMAKPIKKKKLISTLEEYLGEQ
ncbi:AAA family ATPase [Maridesulfovibrio frigidus]|uniref:AAA family ATPase n=1 Tax=Maridesulfovibrio frigidus TaxID=340956 RepID=UPI0004E0D14E|nr:AAA family ATPase [Maridesulfovibrio frigidus]